MCFFLLPDSVTCHYVTCLSCSNDLLSAQQGEQLSCHTYDAGTPSRMLTHADMHTVIVSQSFRPGPLFVRIRANPQLLE